MKCTYLGDSQELRNALKEARKICASPTTRLKETKQHLAKIDKSAHLIERYLKKETPPSDIFGNIQCVTIMTLEYSRLYQHAKQTRDPGAVIDTFFLLPWIALIEMSLSPLEIVRAAGKTLLAEDIDVSRKEILTLCDDPALLNILRKADNTDEAEVCPI